MKADVSGIILAGGRSTRMGFSKAFLKVKGKRMIDIILDVFRLLFDEILIITDDKSQFVDYQEIKVIEDLVKGYGPLAGIYTGLKAISKQRAFFIACDMPQLNSNLIERLLTISLEDDYDCIVPRSLRGIEPLHAVYARSIIPIIEDLLNTKDLSLNQLLNRCKCKYVKVDNDDASSFFNVNTPEELKVVLDE